MLQLSEFLVLLVQFADEDHRLLAGLEGLLDHVLGDFDFLPESHFLPGFGFGCWIWGRSFVLLLAVLVLVAALVVRLGPQLGG